MSNRKYACLIILFNLALLPWTLLGVLWATTMSPTEGRAIARIIGPMIDVAQNPMAVLTRISLNELANRRTN